MGTVRIESASCAVPLYRASNSPRLPPENGFSNALGVLLYELGRESRRTFIHAVAYLLPAKRDKDRASDTVRYMQVFSEASRRRVSLALQIVFGGSQKRLSAGLREQADDAHSLIRSDQSQIDSFPINNPPSHLADKH